MPPSVTVSLLILLCSTFRGSAALLGRPKNVRLSSYNMNLVLRWDLPEGATGDLLYRAEYKSSVSPYRTGCINISALECEFTSHLISNFGTYTGRVQALRGSESSAWVETAPITLDKDTVIGPPSVSLISSGKSLEVSLKEPVFQISDVKSVYGQATYNITYWKSSQSETGRRSEAAQQNRVVLTNLDAWSQYCVQVHIKTTINSNPSVPSNVTCASTTGEGHGAPWIVPVAVFVSISLAVALVVIVVKKWTSISKILFPKDTLPQCLKESLAAAPATSLHPGEEICEQVLLTTRRSSSSSSSVEEETSQPDATE